MGKSSGSVNWHKRVYDVTTTTQRHDLTSPLLGASLTAPSQQLNYKETKWPSDHFNKETKFTYLMEYRRALREIRGIHLGKELSDREVDEH